MDGNRGTMKLEKFLVDIKKKGYCCLRCGYKWIPRKKKGKPRTCPKCRTSYWDKPKKLLM